jgi:hypothetical protein
MPSPTKTIVFTLSLLFLYSGSIAQKLDQPDTTGYVNFNMGDATLPHGKYHQISLYGCNTSITVNSKYPHGYTWNQPNQVLSGVPSGLQIDAVIKEPYYVSKYYIASPPVFKKNANGIIDTNTIYDIGIITPDEFVFNGEKPVQRVYLDYDILEPVYIKYINAAFDESFDSLGINLVPFKVECANFPWIDEYGITGGKGASGIGALNKATNIDKLFLPYRYVKHSSGAEPTDSTKQYLDCQVTILNDILFHHEIFFVIDGVRHQSINLKDYSDKKKSFEIKLHCIPRTELPCGCIEPKKQSPYEK